MNDEELDRLVSQLPRSADVSGELEDQLWAGIEPRIQRRASGRAWGVVLAAAAAVLLSTGAWALAPTPSTATPGLASLPLPATPDDPREGLLPAEGDLQAAVTDLQRAYRQRRDGLDPDVLEIYDENLALVDDAVARSRAALAENPGDPHLQRTLRRAYDQQLSLLSRATRPGAGS